MNALPSIHPTDQTLSSYGLGKLDDGSSKSVLQHLEQCPDCRKRVAEMSADSFLGRIRDAQQPAGQAASARPRSPGGIQGDKITKAQTLPPAGTLPPDLADHPDYRIKRELGRGGMGVVYLAHNTMMGRDEVLKVMGRQMMDRPGVLDRFLREIRAVARLRHPNIVAAYHASRLGESIVFAMEYVEGLDLSRMVKAKGPLPVGHACNFIYQAALGLQHAHEEGLIHRDIKPGNLMLSRKGDRATIKVLDFGLAKATREDKADSALTSAGQALGTPDFIAPEQILDAMSADIRSDIYSLGGTLYYLLAGQPPFQSKSLYDVYQAHISQDANPLNLVRPEVPAELAALVAKMMAKDPARRFQTPAEVAQSLTPFFKKGNAAFKSSRADVSQIHEAVPGRPVSGTVSTPTRPATETGGPVIRSSKAAEPAVPEARWESLIEFKEPETSSDTIRPNQASAAGPTRRPPWMTWRAIAAASFGLIALSIIIIYVITDKSQSKITFDENSRTVKVELESRDGGTPNEKKAGPSSLPQHAEGQEPVSGRAEWKSLFNGKDLSGWVVDSDDEKAWQARDGELVARGRDETDYWRYTGFLLSDRDFSDFLLRFQFRLGSDTAESGIALRAVLHETSRNAKPDDQFNGPFHLSIVFGDYEHGKYPAGTLHWSPNVSVQDPLFPNHRAQLKPVGEWNDIEVEMRGQFLRVAFNGGDVQNLWLNQVQQPKFPAPGLRRYSGRIGFAKRNSEVRFRNIEIKELGMSKEKGVSAIPPVIKPPETVPKSIEVKLSLIPDREKDRRAAGSMLSLGGSVRIRVNGQERPIEPGKALPSEAFQLTQVRLGEQPDLTDSRLEPLAGLTDLVDLRMSKAPKVTDAGVAHLRSLPRLEALWLDGTGVTDAGLAQLTGLTTLKELGLRGTGVTNAGLVHLQGLTRLKLLALGGSRVTDTGLLHLRNLSQLENLWLEATGVADAGLVNLRGLTKLRCLCVWGTKLTDAGLAHLQGLEELELLWLSGPGVTDAGLVPLGNLLKLKNLGLGGARVTGAGLMHLRALRDCPGRVVPGRAGGVSPLSSRIRTGG